MHMLDSMHTCNERLRRKRKVGLQDESDSHGNFLVDLFDEEQHLTTASVLLIVVKGNTNTVGWLKIEYTCIFKWLSVDCY